ncbi:MAG: VOC family protein [Ottowia sp.]|nr:VOC family protein [Ottowia sp.]
MSDTTPSRVDHVVIYGAQELDALVAAYRRLGFTLTPRGHHTLGSSNHLAIFGSDYLELLGVQPENAVRFGDGWNHPPGLSGLVFKTGDASALWQRLQAQGVPLADGKPDVFSRPVELDDGSVHDARFRVVRIALDQFTNSRVFFCEHQTPDLVWRPAWQQHANGALGVAEVVYVAPAPGLQRMAELLAHANQAAQADKIDGGYCLDAGPSKIFFLQRQAAARRLQVKSADLPARDGMVAFTLYTSALPKVRSALRAGQVQPVHDSATRLIVAADDAGGALLSFVEAVAG